ncbi:MAG: alpha/beta hydrolase, partial [Myxococcota bacterium]
RLPPPARVVRALLVGEDAGDALVAAVQAAIARVSPDVLAHRVGEILSVDVREVPAVPVLILRAAGDRLVPADALAVEGRAVTLAGPHLVLQANARGAAAEIASFLVTVGRERAPA